MDTYLWSIFNGFSRILATCFNGAKPGVRVKFWVSQCYFMLYVSSKLTKYIFFLFKLLFSYGSISLEMFFGITKKLETEKRCRNKKIN